MLKLYTVHLNGNYESMGMVVIAAKDRRQVEKMAEEFCRNDVHQELVDVVQRPPQYTPGLWPTEYHCHRHVKMNGEPRILDSKWQVV